MNTDYVFLCAEFMCRIACPCSNILINKTYFVIDMTYCKKPRHKYYEFLNK